MKQLFQTCLLTLLVSMVGVLGFSMNPDEGDYLSVFTNQSNERVSYSLDDLDKITFTENGIRLWNTKWPTEYSYANFRMISFQDPTILDGIRLISIGQNDIKVSYDRIRETVYVESSRQLFGVIIYDLQGQLVAENFQRASNYEISLSHVPHGVYVVKEKGGSVASMKIVK